MSGARLTATVRAASKRPLRPTRAAITLTPSAVTRVREILTESPDVKALKIGVKTRGCNGLSYTLDFATEKAKFDEEVIQDGAKLYIDSKAQLTLLGTVMDYVEEKLRSEFVFENPNIQGTAQVILRHTAGAADDNRSSHSQYSSMHHPQNRHTRPTGFPGPYNTPSRTDHRSRSSSSFTDSASENCVDAYTAYLRIYWQPYMAAIWRRQQQYCCKPVCPPQEWCCRL